MNEVVCPNCHKAFKIDEAGYADILKQVRDDEFDKQLLERLYVTAILRCMLSVHSFLSPS